MPYLHLVDNPPLPKSAMSKSFVFDTAYVQFRTEVFPIWDILPIFISNSSRPFHMEK